MSSLSYGQIQDRINSPPIHLDRDFPVTSLDFRLDISEHYLGTLPEYIIFFGIGKWECENAGVFCQRLKSILYHRSPLC